MENKTEIIKEQREFREERFEFALFVNNNLVCKRNFKITNYIEESMQSLDFKDTIDEIVTMIDNDLKSKSRVYTWYYYDEKNPDPEFTEPLLEPWKSTFKFVVTDNKRPVITKIWDGYGYPKSVRDKVDIVNKTVKITTRDGKTFVFDKETYFEENKDRLSPELYVLRAQIMDKPDLLLAITKKICETCSPREDGYQTTSDYILYETYKNKDFARDENGNVQKDENGNPIFKSAKGKRYYYSLATQEKHIAEDMGKKVSRTSVQEAKKKTVKPKK